MGQLLYRIGLIALLLTIGLGSDFNYTVDPALPAAGTLEELRTSLQKQIGQQADEINMDYNGDHQELSANFADLLKHVFAADDYVAYIVDSYLYTIRTWGGTARIKVTVRYRETVEQSHQVAELTGRVLPAILVHGMPETDRIKAIHDWIVLHVAYDQSLQRYTAYDAIESGKTVCQGYSLLAYRMLKEAGFQARIIEGTVDSGSHVWNLVQIGSEWYHMDVTWDDPIPDREGRVSYNYFLKSDSEMKKDHQWVKSYPAAMNSKT
ncbi:transglutaminase domain-containing protein [Paenibacillus solisilvae]|uniref:Transglutaminase domain-containing protein n=1 Tax=Paenibacillus solisilvae TaxID=2486751 RepID=A0ABW0W401_9BACL